MRHDFKAEKIICCILGGLALLSVGYSELDKRIINKEYYQNKNKLEKLADKNNDGTLNLEETYFMRKAMGTEKKETDYTPTIGEIKKGISYFENQ